MDKTNCINCGSMAIQTDTTRGIICCEDCGMIQEENMIINTIQFDTSNSNKISMQGKVVNIENKNIGTKYIDSSYYIKTTIKNICSKLCLNSKHSEIAFKWYKLCLANNLSKGKSILYTLSACIYISCRQEATPHLLIDFSNVLRIDMYQIGKIFLKIRNTFGLEFNSFDIGGIDMSLYLHRFVSQLKFKNSKEIILLSTRILNRMKKDWIMEGRKPNNSCGAAILLASRILGEPKDISEIAKIVHAAPSTISKRLREISETESAMLNITKFNKEWIEKESNPPIIQINTRQNQKIQSFKNIITEDYCNDSDIVDEMILNNDEVENKKLLWEEMYGDFVKKTERKRNSKKKTITRHIKKKHNFETIEEAFKSLGKKVSSKLNYSIMSNLFEL